ncbi:MAG: aminopeptidase [Candidatus Dormibacteraeota bacterium]|nr:aminopeptidase [Candidatus Dormibacteraeota bacterium]
MPAPLASPFTAGELSRYAEAIIGCLDVRVGDLLVLTYEMEHQPLAVAIAETAYRQGLRVDGMVRDLRLTRAEIDHASDAVLGSVERWTRDRALARTEPGTVLVQLTGETDPDVLDGCDPERVALRLRRTSEAMAELYTRIGKRRDAFLIAGYPARAWAMRAYPDRSPEDAQRALAEDLLRFCRIGPEDDGDGATLREHVRLLRERARLANDLKLRELRFQGSTIDLRLGLPAEAVWRCAQVTNAYGRTNVVNLPSEEIFTSPSASVTEGWFHCTTPLSYQGMLFEDLEAEFAGGRLTRLRARTEAQRDTLVGQLDIDEGGRRLGEVALVDSASRIGRAGRIYRNTLLDENQASHVAFGFGFADCRRDGTPSADMNQSRVHVDVMIGGPDVEVSGRTARGEWVALIEGGIWQPGR